MVFPCWPIVYGRCGPLSCGPLYGSPRAVFIPGSFRPYAAHSLISLIYDDFFPETDETSGNDLSMQWNKLSLIPERAS